MADFLSYFYPLYYTIENLMKSPIILVFKFIGAISSFLLFLGIIYFGLRSRLIQEETFKIQTFLQGGKYEKKRVLKIWKKILKLAHQEEEASRKLALLLADELLEETLERAGWPGKNLEERLAQISPIQLPYLEKIKTAHAFVQKLIHQPDLPLSFETSQEVLDLYEKTLKDLCVLD